MTSALIWKPTMGQEAPPIQVYADQPQVRGAYQTAQVKPRGRPQARTCFTCGQEGHFANVCPLRPRRPSQGPPFRPGAQTPTCHKCGRRGHMAAECRSQSPNGKCSKCGRYGHIADRCRSSSPRRHCTNCGRDGHSADRCRTPPKGGSSSSGQHPKAR